jgi:hypothetical protein
MSKSPYFLLSRILLDFKASSSDVINDLSAATFSPDGYLWVGSDEMIGIERLELIGNNIYGKHQRFLLQDYINLFNTKDEIDIEGMDYSNGYLWLTGSHSSKRKKVKGKSDEKDLEKLATIITEPNRFILARVPIADGKLVKSCSSAGKKLTADCLQISDDCNILFEVLKEDPHLQPFINANIPSKENGLDIEGLVVNGDKLFLGLRGPVLRGWAIILELEIELVEPGVLTLKEITDQGGKYKKHFFDLNGLGVRELCIQDQDIIILAGPTMDLEGEMQIFRWQKALENLKNFIHSPDKNDLIPLFDLPFTIGSDHAEGLALYSYLEEHDSLMVFYDSPDQQRIKQENQIFVDVFRLSK